MRSTLLLSIIAVALPALAGAEIITVPGEHEQVGAALHAASSDDTILVAPGVYVENIVWPPTPGLKLFSEAGPGATILDGGASEAVIGIHVFVDTTTVIRGFTIRNGLVGRA